MEEVRLTDVSQEQIEMGVERIILHESTGSTKATSCKQDPTVDRLRYEQQEVQQSRQPFQYGTLAGPGVRTGPRFCLVFSAIDEHFWWIGAEPVEGLGFYSLWAQVKRGPCSWCTFISCVGFAIPAVLHLIIRRHYTDYLAAFGLLCVSISSPLCDAICVHSNVFDRPPYNKTAGEIGKSEDWILHEIQESGAFSEIVANDRWNILTRLIDRATCVFIVAPALILFLLLAPSKDAWMPQIILNVGGFGIAWFICLIDQRLRRKYPCGIRFIDGHYVTERTYYAHQRLHEIWHFILIATFSASAVYDRWSFAYDAWLLRGFPDGS